MGLVNIYRTNNVDINVIKLVVNLVHLLYYYIQYYFYKRELISKALKYRVLRSRRIKEGSEYYHEDSAIEDAQEEIANEVEKTGKYMYAIIERQVHPIYR